MKVLLVIIFLSLSNFGYSQTDNLKEATKFTIGNYTIQSPKSWKLDTSKAFNTSFILFSPLENDSDTFSENVTLIIQNLGEKNISLEDYKQISDLQIANLSKDGKLIESTIQKSGKANYFKMVYTMSRGKLLLKDIAFCYINKNKAYLLTFSCELDKFEIYKPIAEDILKSFALSD